MEVALHCHASKANILGDHIEQFHPYQPPPTKIPLDVNNKYNVFLSFRGKDVRTTFVDHLYEALTGAGLRVFLDSEELHKGKEIDSSLATAIETSDLFIPIFSKHYAESTWCLKEAAQMGRSNGTIIPLFYDVEPRDVRYPQRMGGLFAEAFEKHYSHLDRHDEKTIEEWKKALYQISSLSGWSRAEDFGYEGRLVKRVVKDVLNTLKINPLDVPVHLVGLEMDICDLVNKLDLNSWNSTVRVGVCGISGVGKTTLAKAVYNTIHAKFDVRFFAQKNTTLVDMQQAILRRLVNYLGEVSSVAEGKALMRNQLRGVRVLVILDDVNDWSHLDAVNGDWFGPGSRVIITSRDKHILNLAKVDSVIHMTGLEDDEALELFSWHAFSTAFPKDPYIDISTKIARACRGFPLSLQVIGAHLFDKKERDDIHECWEEALHNIGENQEISRVLRVSYDGLSPVEKEVFLDIACFFAGERKTDAVTFWEVLYPNRVKTALKNLFLKMLINYSGPEDILEMHDLLQGLGRWIQELADNNSRLFLPMGAHRTLSTDRTEGVNMLVYTGENGRDTFSIHTMPCLRYLVLQNTKVVGSIGNMTPNLLWIKFRNCEFVSDWVYMLLTLRNRFRLDSNWFQVRILSVEQCSSLARIPTTVDSLVNLRCLYLQDCVALTSLPNTLGNLGLLEQLHLRGCASLTSLPDTVGNLKHLKRLVMFECTGLRNLPSSTGNLIQLETLDLRGCLGLIHLPNTINKLAQLRVLNVRGCLHLENLHDPLAKLQNLRIIYLSGRVQRERFHDGVAKLARLRELNRSGGKGSLVHKKFQVYFVYHEADEGEMSMGDKYYKCLRTGSLRICRESEDNGNSDFREAIESTDIFVPFLSRSFAESNVCMRILAAIRSSNGLVIALRLRSFEPHSRIKFSNT